MDLGRNRSRGAGRLALTSLAAVVILAAAVAGASAEDANEATAFGTDGIAAASLGTRLYAAEPTGVTARSDGGVVVRQGRHLDSYLADGSPDPAAPPVPLPAGRAFPGAAGKSYVLDGRNLTRLAPDGTVDRSFGNGGTAEVPRHTGAVVELSSGRIDAITVVRGQAKIIRNLVKVVILQPDGRSNLRPSYTGEAGRAPAENAIRDTPATPDGGALAVGGRFILRLRADGSVDKQFGSDGEIKGEAALFAGARFLADGSIEAVGTGYVDGERAGPAIVRYTAAGRLVASFGKKGMKLIDAPGWQQAEVASWGADGSVVIGGTYEVTEGKCSEGRCEEGPALAAFDPDGNPESGFGEGGLVRLTALAGPSAIAYAKVGFGVTALTRRPDGSIVAVGAAPPDRQVGFLAAISPQGALLPGFGDGGIVRVAEPGPASEGVLGIAPLPGGGLLAAGRTDVGGPSRPVLVRYEADGSLDRSFGAGTGFVDLADPKVRRPKAFAVGDGRALVGFDGGRSGRLLMANVDDGSPVTTFGSGGSVALSARIFLRALLLEADGDPVVLGDPGAGPLADPAVLLRLGADGSPDPTFGTGGKVRLHGSGAKKCESLATAPDGGLLVGCLGSGRLVVAHLRPDGALDRRYGNSLGWAIVPVPGGRVGSVEVAQVGSRTYVAGSVSEVGHPRLALARLDSHGHPDKGFGHRGIRVATIAAQGRPSAIVPTRAGTVVTLESGPRPVVTFTHGGAVRREAPGPTTGTRTFGNVHATAFGSLLVVGWSPSERPDGEGPYFLSARPLDP